MSKTLQLLGYEVGERPVTDEMRLDYGFPTDPYDLHNLAVKVMQGNTDPSRYKRGSDFGLAIADVFRGDRTGDTQGDGEIIRPFGLDQEDMVVWQGICMSFPRVAQARGIQRGVLMPEFEDLGSPKMNGELLGEYIRVDGSKHTARIFSVASEEFSLLRNTRLIDFEVVEDSVAFIAINAYGHSSGEEQ